VIVQMAKVRIAGPRELVERALAVVQDLGVLHVVNPPPALEALPAAARETRHLSRLLDDVNAALTLLGADPFAGAPALPPLLAPAARFAHLVRRQAERIAQVTAALEEERVLLLRYQEFFAAFAPLLGRELERPDRRAFYLVLRAGAADQVERLRESLTAAAGQDVELIARPISGAQTAVLLLTSEAATGRVGRLLNDARVQELPAPAGLGETHLLTALPKLKARLESIPERLAAQGAARERLKSAHEARLGELRAWLHDRMLLLDAREHVVAGAHLFVLEGWLPEPQVKRLISRATELLGRDVVVEKIATEPWSRGDAPVEMKNPPLFKPFEVLTRMLPLPRYGSIDPTPFMAVFFPMFFGLMMGDVGYGAALALLSGLLHWRSKPDSTLRNVARIGGACAAFAIAFGFVFGELFGNLGQRFGLKPLGFDRQEAILPFLVLAVSLGVVHVVLGLVLAVVQQWRGGHKRAAMGRSVAGLMVLLTVLALLAAFEVIPSRLITPFAIALAVAFPLLIALEGIVAVVELLSSFGHILSYARIMALGTASVMMAVVANRMVGTMGSALVGVLFALLFHLVNFAIGLFSPAIHSLRLHYVEFFGKFFSPGGAPYHPLAHWAPHHNL
jgi:V/A-type H+-transporting ATPase subunit I